MFIMFIMVICMFEYFIVCLFFILLFFLLDLREDISLFGCLVVNVFFGIVIFLYEFFCDINLMLLCEYGIYRYFY